ncbi:hypothetical protein E3N88_33981 [Mikania micrantha]|uniref:Uncharacterized protein n=1 Tax=Mikania micrantha TaxID=192012 RepID=A0A5N6MD35_9ASTR|nr:hypothetical protein E3N88_33981 [Mikania micrantha]
MQLTCKSPSSPLLTRMSLDLVLLEPFQANNDDLFKEPLSNSEGFHQLRGMDRVNRVANGSGEVRVKRARETAGMQELHPTVSGQGINP